MGVGNRNVEYRILNVQYRTFDIDFLFTSLKTESATVHSRKKLFGFVRI